MGGQPAKIKKRFEDCGDSDGIVDLARFGLQDGQCRAVIDGMIAMGSKIKVLDFDDNDIGDEGAQAVAKALHHCRSLTVLSFSKNNIGETGARAVAEALHQCSSIKLLSFSKTNIGEKGARAVAEALHRSPSLRVLNLSFSSIGEAGAQAVAEALNQCPELTKLYLYNNNIGAMGARAVAEALPLCPRLKEVYLYNNNIGSAGARAVAEAVPQCQSLTKLSLGNNHIGEAGARAVAQALWHHECPSLTKLDLGGNNINDVGARALAEALHQCPILTVLYLHNNAIGVAGAEAVAKALHQCPRLTKLSLSLNNIGATGAQAVAEALHQCESLLELYLYSNNIGSAGARAVAEALEQCPSLTVLHLHGNNIGEAGARAVAQILSDRPHPALTTLRGIDLRKHAKALGLPAGLADATNRFSGGLGSFAFSEEPADTRNEAILRFLRERAEGAGPARLAVAKVMVTGPGSAGKTCLVERLVGRDFPLNSGQTNGVAMKSWEEPGATGLHLRYYDFGGQETYATSHQLFLRTRAVFLVVWNSRTSCSREAGFEAYLRDVLDASPQAKLLFVCTKQDEDSMPATPDQRRQLQQAYGDQVHGFYHVSSRTGAGIDELRRGIVEAANTLEHMGEQVPATYIALQAALQRRRAASDSPLTIPLDTWHAEATAAGFTDPERALQALKLFHAMGEVLRLPSKKNVAGAIVLAPQRLADVLAQVITANEGCAGNTVQGLLPHHRLGAIWPGLTADVRSSVLELIHECNLGYPVEAEGENVIGATLIPAMLPDLDECAIKVLDALRTQNPDLAAIPSLKIELSSFTERLSAQLHVRFRRLVTVGGWWRYGCVVAGCEEEDVSASVDNDGTMRFLFFGRVSWDLQTRVVRVEGHGDRYMLQQRVLRGLHGALEGFPGTFVAGLALQCACGGSRVWHTDEMRAATKNGKELVCPKKKTCRRRLQPADIVNWVDAFATVNQGEWEDEEDEEEEEEEENKDDSEAAEAPLAGIFAPSRRASRNTASQVRRIVDYLRGKLSGDPAVPTRELQDAFLGCYPTLVQAGAAGAAPHPDPEAKTLWLLYTCGSDNAELAAYPLCPRLRGRWVVVAPARVVVPSACSAHASVEQRELTDVVMQVVTALSVVNPNREALFGALWACDDAEVANHIRYQSDVLFVPAEHPEHPGLWVHREDYPVFAAERMMTATGAGVQAVRDAIRSDPDPVD